MWSYVQGFPNSRKEWREEIRNFIGIEFFYQVKETWGGVVLNFQTFFKAKQLSVNTEHELK